MTLATLRLNKNEERRLRGGHLWIESADGNDAVTITSPAPDRSIYQVGEGIKGVYYDTKRSMACV